MNRQQLIDAAYAAEKKYGLPKGMLVAQLHQESSDGTNTYNPEGPVGVMQIQPATAQKLGFDPNDPMAAIDGAAQIMKGNLATANGNVGKALELYYAGSDKGIGPRSKAYPGQVASKWDDDDAFDAASNFSAPQQDDDDKTFEASANLTGNAPAPTETASDATPEDPHIAAVKQGMQQITDLTRSPYQVRRYVRESGYDPDKLQNLDENVQAGKLNFGPGFDQRLASAAIEHNTSNDLFAGMERGASDVSGTLRGLASYMDRQYPALAAIDRAFSKAVPAFDPGTMAHDVQSNILARRAYDQNYDSPASGTGRLGAQVALAAPLIAPAAGALPAIPEGANLLTRGLALAGTGAAYGAAGNALTSAASDQSLGERVTQGAEGGAVLGPAVGAIGAGASAIANRVGCGQRNRQARPARAGQVRVQPDRRPDHQFSIGAQGLGDDEPQPGQ
jgi:hypothetical protein